MGRAGARADFSGALSAIVVVALILATTALMLVTLNAARATGEIAGGSCSAYGKTSPSCEVEIGGLISLSLLAK
jgi:hypothetical protein